MEFVPEYLFGFGSGASGVMRFATVCPSGGWHSLLSVGSNQTISVVTNLKYSLIVLFGNSFFPVSYFKKVPGSSPF